MHNRPGQGRKLKATTIRERERGNNRAPDASARLPQPPTYLDAAARREWRRVGKRLLSAGLLTPAVDSDALAAYCVARARMLEAERQLKLTGKLVVEKYDKQGQLVTIPSPYLAIIQKERDIILRIMGEFGMTPASRSRLPASEPKRPTKAPEQPAGDAAKPLGDPRGYLRVVS